jgi:hypothetical protein
VGKREDRSGSLVLHNSQMNYNFDGSRNLKLESSARELFFWMNMKLGF